MSVSNLFSKGKRPNILIIITDQERAIQHWPDSFSKEHLPALERLKKHGLTFQNHYTNTCMCSPSRSTLLTSQFPVKTGVTRTGSPGPPTDLPTDIPNLATVLKKAGYPKVEWHGKWHVGKTPADYGFEGWQPPDAGNYLAVNSTLGGGTPDNDGRFLKDLCRTLEDYHQQEEKEASPFCIVASFVNPHDVYVAQHGPAMGYTQDDYHKVKVPLPSNYTEDPDKNNKPRAQGRMSMRYVPFESSPQEYINFYAHLHTVVDAQIGKLLDQVDNLGFTDSTLILRTADHGEQGLSHSLVEKFYNCYQESLKIPFIVSNPLAFPEPRTTDALSSHLDILPTLVGLLDGGDEGPSLQGTNLAPVLDNPELRNDSHWGVQSRIHFTYDDIPCPGAPSTIRCIHKGKLKYAVYFTRSGRDADWELYDLEKDPLEDTNLAGKPEYEEIQKQMEKELYETMVEMGTLPETFEWPPKATPYSQGYNHPETTNDAADDEEVRDETPPNGAYKFSDDGDMVKITIQMEKIESSSSENIDFEFSERSVSMIVKNFGPDDVALKFEPLFSEIIAARYELQENEIVLFLTKQDSSVEWKGVHYVDPEVQSILDDPKIQQILKDLRENPLAAHRAMSDPHIREGIIKLVESGVLRIA